MLKFQSIMLGSENSESLVKFYTALFEREPDMRDDAYASWNLGNGSSLSVGPHSEVKGLAKEPQRILINFETEDTEKDFERISSIDGVKVIAEPYEMEGWEGYKIATFTDPDGNYLQLMPHWDMENMNK